MMKLCEKCNRAYNGRTVRGGCECCYKKRYKKPQKQRVKRCVICGQEFTATGAQISNKRYCGQLCRWQGKLKSNSTVQQKHYRQEWAFLNRDKTRAASRRAYDRAKRDLRWRLKCNLRSRLRFTMGKDGKITTSKVALANLGCSIDELMRHLQSLWQPGMSWDNYGRNGWHIDHIQPIAQFDVSNADHLKIVCNYKNLRPLWAKDNFKKGSKVN